MLHNATLIFQFSLQCLLTF